MEPAVAALIPALLALAATASPRMSDDLRRAIRFWFVPLALLWLAPSWLSGRTPIAFDLLGEVWPWRVLTQGPAEGNPLLNDAVFQFIPWRHTALHGAWRFLWTNPQAALLYPLTWLGAFFSPAAWPLFAGEAKLLIAAIGTYVFLRGEERSHAGALLGAIAYAFCIFTVAFLFAPQTNVTVMLPWMLAAVRRPRAAGVAAFFLAAAGGHPESLAQAMLVVVPFALRQGPRVALRAGIVALAGVALAAPQLVPFASVVGESERMAQLARNPSLVEAPALTLQNVEAFVAPWALKDRIVATWRENFNEAATQYAGLLTLGLAILAAVTDTRRQRFWIAIFVVASLLAFENPIVRHLPIFGLMLHGRVRFVIAFATAVLASGVRRPIVFPIVIAADLFLVMFNFYPPVERRWVYPATPAISALHGRIATVGLALPPNTAAMYGLEDIGTHDPMTWEPYARVLEAGGYDRRGYFAVFHTVPPPALLDFLGVRFIVVPPDVAGTPPLPVAYRGGDAVVLANPTALPRFFIPRGFDATESPIDAWRRTPDAGVVHLRRGERIALAPATVRVDGETIAIRAAGETFVASSVAAIPGWELTADGAAQPLVRVNDAFIGWRVPAGEHRFRLRYTPPHLALGFVIALMAIPLIAITLRAK